MGEMFKGCSSLKNLYLSNNFKLDTARFLSNMFSDCISLEYLDLSTFDTTNTRNLDYLFSNCTSLTSINIGNLNTSDVFSISKMFYLCS